MDVGREGLGRARLARLGRLTALLLVIGLASCTQTSGTSQGIVIDVEGTLAEVTAFTVLVEGDPVRYLPVEGGDYAFPLPHLREHQRSGAPIVVHWQLVGETRHALGVTDG